MIWVLLQSESPWQRDDAITFLNNNNNEIYSLLFSPILQHFHISERFQKATKRGKFSRAAWEFDVALNSRQ